MVKITLSAIEKMFAFVFAPLAGAEKFTLRIVEGVRSLNVGAIVGVLLLVCQFALAHMDLLPIPLEKQAQVAAAVGAIVTLLQLAMRYYQHDPNTPQQPKA